jgi:hypothetical protein
MKKFYLLLLSVSLLCGMNAFAQCPTDVSVFGTTGPTSKPLRPTCGLANGNFAVRVEGSGAINIDVSINNGATYTTVLSNNVAGAQFLGDTAGLYHIKVRVTSNPSVTCDSFDFLLRADYNTTYTHVPSSATGCYNADGSILLGGSALGTDSISWISSYNPTFTRISTLAPANTISGLTPGLYYLTIKGTAHDYCFTTDSVRVGNTGTACPAATFCATATDSSNLSPDSTFGSGVPLNKAPLPAGRTTYEYQPIGPYSPEDGFYAIANNTFVGAYTSYNDGLVKVTPFDNGWGQGWDHDHWTTGLSTGYMMVVNADVDPNIVLQETINNLCVGKTYQFSAWIRSLVPNSGGNSPSNETFLVDGVGLYNTGNMFGTLGAPVQADWKHVGFTFVAQGTTAIISMRNNAPGGQGNDFALDDIYVGSCTPTVVITPLPADPCNHPPANDSAVVTDASDLFQYYIWQVNKHDGNGYVDVAGGPQTGTFVSHTYTAITPLDVPLKLDSGFTFRLLVATAPANLSSATCRFTSLDSSTIPYCPDPPLAVSYINVKAQLNNSIGDVYWKVDGQLNVDHYELEKSTDQLSYSLVSTVTATSGSGLLSYASEDNNLASGINYYRVKVVNADGTYSYSNIAPLTYLGSGEPITVFPTTASTTLTVLTSADTKLKNAVIYDAIGRKVLEQDNFNNSDPTIAVGGLNPGFYNIKIYTTSGDLTNLSFIKK